jgi:CubicO group peptidase (beta-lactamase class C family)
MPNRIASRFYAALLAVVAAPPLLTAQQEPVSGPPPSAAALAALVDSVVRASLLAQGVPSVSVVVTRGDETLVQGAWGRADVASGRAADTSTVYGLGSNAKQFTAALVLRLVDRGRLTLGDSIGRHLSGLRPEWREITVEQLLNHTSGLQRSYLPSDRMEEDLPADSLLAQAAQDTMFARPGTQYIYSNVGYLVLRVLVEKLYGKPYAAALRDEITRPLGLATLGACGDVEAGSRATGYMRFPDGTLSSPPTVHPSQELGPSGLCSTAADLARWNRALHGGRVLSEAAYTAMITPRGVSGVYGLGLSAGRVQWGDTLIAHGGRGPTGFTSENAWYPADSLSVTILYNVFPALDIGGTHVIAALALGQTPPDQGTPAPQPAVADTPAIGIIGAEALRRFVGEYELGRAVFKVDSVGGALVLTTSSGIESPLVHESGATYAVPALGPGTAITFLADAQGRVVGFEVRYEGDSNRRLRKIR